MSAKPAAKSRSGEHEAVRAYRSKLESISDMSAPGKPLDVLTRRIDEKLKAYKSDRPAKDPRREEGEDEIPVDTVDLADAPTLRVLPAGLEEEPDPFPKDKP